MSMKGIASLMGMTLALGGSFPHLGHSHENYNRKRKKKDHQPLPDSLGIPEHIHKGHTTEPVTFEFVATKHVVSINCTVTYGTLKSRLKRINAVRRELEKYLSETPIEKIIEFGQFEIVSIPNP